MAFCRIFLRLCEYRRLGESGLVGKEQGSSTAAKACRLSCLRFYVLPSAVGDLVSRFCLHQLMGHGPIEIPCRVPKPRCGLFNLAARGDAQIRERELDKAHVHLELVAYALEK